MATHSRRAPPVSHLPLLLGILLVAAAAVPAQNPTLPPPSQAQSALQQALQQNPGLADVIRQKLVQSGMSADQVRARLAASGYAPGLLDAYLGGAGQAPGTPGAQELAAIEALGLGSVAQPGQELPVDTGIVRREAARRAEEIASGDYVFGVDVFRRTTTQFLPTLAGPVP